MTAAILLLISGWAAAAEAGPRIQPTTEATRVEVSAVLPDRLLAGLPAGRLTPEQGERRLRLALLHPETGAEGPPIFGAYERRQNRLHFTPRYPLAHGQRYRATLELGPGQVLTAEYQAPPRPVAAPAMVEKIYPSAVELPANHLKFYLHFSRPMREGRDIFDHLQILDEDGKPILDPWRRTELWSADGRRLTLWIHPGRIKEGVNLREELGPVLEPERRYTLVVGPALRDADGQALGKAFQKKFCTTAAERSLLRVEDWTVQPPRAGARQPLVVKFPRPLDRALLDRLVTVANEQGQTVAGRIEVGPEERSWLFHPEQPWQPLPYTLVVDPRLEDLAGNTPQRLFDVDLAGPGPTPAKLTRSFRPPAR
jgi:hypothetical protein